MLTWLWRLSLLAADALAAFNQFLVVAVVVTAVSLLLFTLTFNLRDRVARSFVALLACLAVVYLGDAAASAAQSPESTAVWLRFQWIGIAFTPATYLHFSDALLATTGRPSRGRRRLAVRLTYGVGIIVVGMATLSDLIVHDVVVGPAVERLLPGPLFLPFGILFVVATALSVGNVYRAYLRCLTATTRRRMAYLLFSSLAPPISVFPYLLLAGSTAANTLPMLFWMSAVAGNALVGALLVIMAYSVSFFGSPQPDRVIRGRLFQWILRGPLVASFVLAAYVAVRWFGRSTGLDTTLLVPVAVTAALLIPQFAITLLRLPVERLFFYGRRDRDDVQRIQTLGERLLTAGDVRQFLESVLAAACEALHVSSGFVAVSSGAGARIEVRIGPAAPIPDELGRAVVAGELHTVVRPLDGMGSAGAFAWEGFWILPLRAQSEAEGLAQSGEVLGLLGLAAPAGVQQPPADELQTLELLARRAAAALEDRRLQRQVFHALDTLLLQVDELQRMRAAARYSGASALTAGDLARDPNAVQWVKDALSHYWGGPKLTQSPLLGLGIVHRALREHDGNAVNALRAVLRDAIEQVKPDGQRKSAPEWILYNILEMKFLEGRKVREIAMRLAMSEADLYRKQRVAVEEVVRAIVNMERQATEELSTPDAVLSHK